MKFKLLVLIWFVAVLSGFHLLMNYSGVAGRKTASVSEWPLTSTLEHPSQKHLVIFIHPGCSCSKASLTELSKLMSSHKELTAQVVFMKSPKLENLFTDNDLLKKARLLPRAKIVHDALGAEAKLFHAETSGHTFLYDEESRLLFSGGLTMARGHEGNSAGQDAITKHLEGQKSLLTTSIFGCDLFGMKNESTKI